MTVTAILPAHLPIAAVYHSMIF